VGYATPAWGTFGAAVAAAAGAVTGLLFVALSVKATALSASLALSWRAAQTLVLFMTSVPIAVVLTAPQPSTAIGAELLALAVICEIGLLIPDRRAGHAAQPGVTRCVERFSPNTITAILVGGPA
jgi:modulator of FtsH protease